jgi:anti-sigma B factor antagonist
MQFGNAVRQVESVTIVTLEGRLQLGDGTTTLRELAKGLVGHGQKSVLLELRDLTYIDSAGIGALMAFYTSLRNGGGELKLLSPSQRVRGLLVMMKLFPIFEVFEDEAAALASFTQAAGG